jgi:AcrR family transcriptional regulator
MTNPTSRSMRPRLDRKFIVSFRRRRLMVAMAQLCVERGYRATTIAHIASQAGVARNTVYDNFPNREALFLALLEEATGELLGEVETACLGAGEEGEARFEAALAAILEWIAANPAFAWVLLVEAPCSCPAAFDHHLETTARFIELLRASVPDDIERPEVIEEMLVGGITSILRYLVHNGEAERAPELLPTLTAFADVPYLPDDGR